jgi:hypothetical protein
MHLSGPAFRGGTTIRGSGAVRYADDTSNRVNLPELLPAAAASIRHGILTCRVICPLASVGIDHFRQVFLFQLAEGLRCGKGVRFALGPPSSASLS